MYETYDNLKFNRNLTWMDAKIPEFTPSIYPSALINQVEKGQKHYPDRVLFILNESWGVFNIDKTIDRDVMSPITQLTDTHILQIEQGQIDVGTSTTMAELRELCALTSDSPNFKLGDMSKFDQCLPRKFKRTGYKVNSFHAADSRMYARDVWYASLGFTHPVFYPDLKNLERCHSFPGGCDYNILSEVETLLLDESKQFIYWLTLNTHHPYSDKDIKQYYFNCSNRLFDDRQEACRNLNLQKQFFTTLAKSIQKGSLKNTDIIIVGDHTPPMVLDRKKDSFEKNKTHWLHIKVR